MHLAGRRQMFGAGDPGQPLRAVFLKIPRKVGHGPVFVKESLGKQAESLLKLADQPHHHGRLDAKVLEGAREADPFRRKLGFSGNDEPYAPDGFLFQGVSLSGCAALSGLVLFLAAGFRWRAHPGGECGREAKPLQHHEGRAAFVKKIHVEPHPGVAGAIRLRHSCVRPAAFVHAPVNEDFVHRAGEKRGAILTLRKEPGACLYGPVQQGGVEHVFAAAGLTGLHRQLQPGQDFTPVAAYFRNDAQRGSVVEPVFMEALVAGIAANSFRQPVPKRFDVSMRGCFLRPVVEKPRLSVRLPASRAVLDACLEKRPVSFGLQTHQNIHGRFHDERAYPRHVADARHRLPGGDVSRRARHFDVSPGWQNFSPLNPVVGKKGLCPRKTDCECAPAWSERAGVRKGMEALRRGFDGVERHSFRSRRPVPLLSEGIGGERNAFAAKVVVHGLPVDLDSRSPEHGEPLQPFRVQRRVFDLRSTGWGSRSANGLGASCEEGPPDPVFAPREGKELFRKRVGFLNHQSEPYFHRLAPGSQRIGQVFQGDGTGGAKKFRDPSGVCLKALLVRRGEDDQLRRCPPRLIWTAFREFFDDHVCVRSTRSECAHSRPPWGGPLPGFAARRGRGPWLQPPLQTEWGAREIDIRIDLLRMDGRGDHAVAHLQEDLREPGYPGRRFQVADVRFHRSDGAVLRFAGVGAVGVGEPPNLRRVAEGRARAVGFHVADRARIDASALKRLPDDFGLKSRVGGGVAVAPASMVDRRRLDDAMDVVAVAESVREGPQKHCAHPFSGDVAVSSRPETPASSVARREKSLAELDVLDRVQRKVHPSGERHGAFAAPDALAGQMDGGER